MKALGSVSFLLIFFGTNKADSVDNEFNEGSIEEMYVLDNGRSLSGLVFLKQNEDTTPKSNEEENIEILLPEDIRDYEIANKDDLGALLNSNTDGISEESRGVLRRRPWRGCLKKASKICMKACKRAYKNSCSYRDCAKKLKKTLKKECKRECKSFFVGD